MDILAGKYAEAEMLSIPFRNRARIKAMVLGNNYFIFYLRLKHPDILTCLEGFDAGKEWTYDLMPRKLKPDFFSGYIQHTNAKHINWLKQHQLMPRRIVYGVDSSNLETALQCGFRNIMLDYDSSMQIGKVKR